MSQAVNWKRAAYFQGIDDCSDGGGEVEAVLNSRPLTYVYSEDVEEPLMPSRLLIGRRLLTLPDAERR